MRALVDKLSRLLILSLSHARSFVFFRSSFHSHLRFPIVFPLTTIFPSSLSSCPHVLTSSLPPALLSSVHPFLPSLNFVFFHLTLFQGQPFISLRQQLLAASSSLFLTFSLSIYSFYLPHYRSILYPPLVSHFPHTPSYIYPSLFIYFINPSLYVFPIKRFHN